MEQAGTRMRLTLIHPAQAQEQSQSPSTTQYPVVPAPPGPDATTSEVEAGQADPAARSSGWTDVDEWWVFILVLVAIAVLVIGYRRRRRSGR
jgi:hypothetical protein